MSTCCKTLVCYLLCHTDQPYTTALGHHADKLVTADDSTIILGLAGVLQAQPKLGVSEEVEALILDIMNEDRLLEALREASLRHP